MGRLATLRVDLDEEADAAFVYLDDDPSSRAYATSVMCDLEVLNGAVILLLDGQDRLIGLEVLGAAKLLPPGVLAAARRKP